jgi:hypothetical protein
MDAHTIAKRIFLTYVIETLCLSSVLAKIVSVFKINHRLNPAQALKIDYKTSCDPGLQKYVSPVNHNRTLSTFFLLNRAVGLQVFHGGRYEVAISYLDFLTARKGMAKDVIVSLFSIVTNGIGKSRSLVIGNGVSISKAQLAIWENRLTRAYK